MTLNSTKYCQPLFTPIDYLIEFCDIHKFRNIINSDYLVSRSSHMYCSVFLSASYVDLYFMKLNCNALVNQSDPYDYKAD